MMTKSINEKQNEALQHNKKIHVTLFKFINAGTRDSMFQSVGENTVRSAYQSSFIEKTFHCNYDVLKCVLSKVFPSID